MTREEAIEVYNGLINTKIKEAFEFFAPELRESEDEKMMRVIGLALTDVPEERFTSLGTTLKDCLTWIEQQNHDGKKWITPAELNRLETLRYEAGFDAGVRSEKEKQKEQKPAEGLEEEIKRMVYDVVYDLDGPAIMGTSEYLSVEDIASIARHFYELGLNARKEDK